MVCREIPVHTCISSLVRFDIPQGTAKCVVNPKSTSALYYFSCLGGKNKSMADADSDTSNPTKVLPSPEEAQALLNGDFVTTKKISVDSGISNERVEDSYTSKLTSSENGETNRDELDGFVSPESRVLQKYYHKLMTATEPELVDLCAKLYSEDMISLQTKYKVIDSSNGSSISKSAILLKDIECSIAVKPQFLLDLLKFFECEASEALKALSREMRYALESTPPVPPKHSMSEGFVLPLRQRKACITTSASSPAAFTSELSSMCEQCEFQNRALYTMFEKFCQDYLKASLNIIAEDEKEDLNYTNVNSDSIETEQCDSLKLPCPLNLQASLDAELRRSSTPSGPKSELEASLFQPSLGDRQWSYESNGSDEFFARITNDFLQKIRDRHRQSKKNVIIEKKMISEKLKRTEEEFREISSQRNEGEQELIDAREEISVLKQSLEDAQSRQNELAKEVLRCKRQLLNEKCQNGNSLECKHFMRCSSLEAENNSLKRQVESAESDCTNYKTKIEALELQISMLLGNVSVEY